MKYHIAAPAFARRISGIILNWLPLAVFFLAAVSSLIASIGKADIFGSGTNTFEIEFVTIGAPGNLADTTGDPNPAGAVSYEYRLGKYEISEQMINKANAQSSLDGTSLGITIDTRGPNKPATRASWFEAAQFVNWLNTSSGATPAYKFDDQGVFHQWDEDNAGFDPGNLFRNAQAKYFLPSADEWYKAAFYDPVTASYFDFPNGSDTAPSPVASGTDPNTAIYNQAGPADIWLAGGSSPFGSVGQAGNVWEWEETEVDLVNDNPQANRGFRGDNWGAITVEPIVLSSAFRHSIYQPDLSNGAIGFRIASVIPEPATMWLFVVASWGLCTSRRALGSLWPV